MRLKGWWRVSSLQHLGRFLFGLGEASCGCNSFLLSSLSSHLMPVNVIAQSV